MATERATTERIFSLMDLKNASRNAAKVAKKKYLDHAIVVLPDGKIHVRVYVFVGGKVQQLELDVFSA